MRAWRRRPRRVTLDAVGPLALILTMALSPATGAASGPGRDVSFLRDIRPILSNHCFACHGPDAAARKADLSLVTFEDATREIEPGVRAIAPGDRGASLVWQRINDAADPMPPHEEHKALTPAQIDHLGRWIDAGASYAPHWAYVAPVRAAAPEVFQSEWPDDDIDRFVLARLESEGLPHAPDASRETLIRRATFDVLGLPPRSADIDAFLVDAEPGAFARVVDRLLASPHFGERLAVLWLDLVRYADTVGYHGDQDQNIWPYRDWVIDAFNANLPFDQFTIDQLAGDLLPEPTQAQLVATGYHRLLQTTHEGGLQLKEYRAIYQADRVRNFSETWMGATVGCAQCHDHKYDPYTTRDFYALGAFFADVDDEEHLRKPYDGLNTVPTRRSPEMRVFTDGARAEVDRLAVEIAQLEDDLDDAWAELDATRAAWEAELIDRIAAATPVDALWVDDVLDTGGTASGDWTFGVVDDVAPHSGQSYRVQSHDGLVQHYTEGTERRITVDDGTSFYVWMRVPAHAPPQAVMLQFHANGSWEHRALWGSDAIPYGRQSENWGGYRRRGALPAPGAWARLDVAAAAIDLAPGTVVDGIAFTQFAGTVYWDRAGAVQGQAAPPTVASALATAPGERSEEQRTLVDEHHRATAPHVVALRDELAARRARRDTVTRSMPLTMYTRALEDPRPVRVLPRGNWLDESGPVVAPAIPAFLGRLDTPGRATRLDLARWLVRDESQGGVAGFTARVFVNRVWALLFGTGLCPSVEDFGGQGRPPNHPELLDRLAIDFIDSGWDVKALVRRLLLTHAYRQSSVPTPEQAERDPTNELFGRQARFRVEAEFVRDTVLRVSGLLLEDDIGGRSVKPAQPAGYYRHLNFPHRRYRPDTGPEQWRRGVYMHWQRQFLHPMLRAFDAPTREECTAQRSRSNTPLAALTLLNDPVMVAAARALAERVRSQDLAPREAIAFALREATGRHPTDDEIAIIERFQADTARDFAADPGAAAEVVQCALLPPPGGDPVELATWMQVARVILNLHETLERE